MRKASKETMLYGLRMPRGISCQNSIQFPTESLEIPATTGMQYLKTKSYAFWAVADFIIEQAKKYGEYKPDSWDSFDLSCLVAADVRYRFPGQPIGILLGKRKEGMDVGGYGAINILWFEKEIGDGKKEWCARYFDATICRNVERFEIEVIIPIPISGLVDHNELLPLENIMCLRLRAESACRGQNLTIYGSGC